MIQTIITHTCSRCGSANIVKNGHNKCGSQQYYCKDCGARRVLKPKHKYASEQKETILKTYKERASLRGLERIYQVSRSTVLRWMKDYVQTLPDLRKTLLPAEADDVLELDEMWSFVFKKDRMRWIWTAISRKTRQIVAFVIGNRSEATCRRLWKRIPKEYRALHTFSDFWRAYQAVFPKKTHRSVGKESGETAHMERWYNTLRQRLARFVRKTLSFSKSDVYHHIAIKWFITEYNLELSSLTT